jgi:hypothetical protein
LRVPSYVLFGNHDGLVQGNEDATAAIERIATGCEKALEPVPGFNPFGVPDPERFALEPPRMLVPPDERRQFVDKLQFKRLFDTGHQGDAHGFALVDPPELAASNGAASYYDFSPKPGLRFIMLDTLSEGGVVGPSSEGNIDDPQFLWLGRELEQATERNELVVVFAHHATGSLSADVADELASPCTVADQHGHDVNPGCDLDPRISAPVHLADDTRALLLRFPNVVAYVAGHSHDNAVTPFSGAGGHGFWEIKSPAVADWPPQHRLVEVMDNRDGTLSIFATMLDHASPSRSPGSGNARQVARYDPATLASIGRTLSYNDPQEGPDGSEGTRADRNVELLIDDPRQP